MYRVYKAAAGQRVDQMLYNTFLFTVEYNPDFLKRLNIFPTKGTSPIITISTEN
jgi:hypothetical protein